MMRRMILTVLSLMLVLLTGAGVRAQGTPTQSTPSATPAAELATPIATGPVVADYAAVGSAYDAATESILTLGRDVSDALIAGDMATVYARMSPQVRQLGNEETLRGLLDDLQTDRVHFELSEFGVIFDGHLDGATIDGYFVQGGVGSFHLEAAIPQAATPSTGGLPLAGPWDGTITMQTVELQIVVEFVSEGDTLTARIDIPEQGITAMSLANVSFQPRVELGAQAKERALPHDLAIRSYLASYACGEASIVLSLAFDAAGTIVSFFLVPQWPLPPDPANASTPVLVSVPFRGTWWVYWGGETEFDNYHAVSPSQRHDYDILIWKDGGTFHGAGTANADYWAWGQEIRAPVAGTVVATLNDIPDNVPGQLNPEAHPAGNHVVIETGERSFVFLAHLQQGGVKVNVGDRVQGGDVVGIIGNSGNTSEPHLHIHAQDTADFFAPAAIGLPLRFTGYLVDGKPATDASPQQGMFIGAA